MINQGMDSADQINLDSELDRQFAGSRDFLDENDIIIKRGEKKMRTIKVSVKAKIGALETSSVFDYDEPDNWQEAIQASEDGEASEFKIYLIKRKTNFQDAKRSKMVKQLTSKLGALSKDKLIELGLNFDDDDD